MSRGEVLLGEIMTKPASLMTGDAATAAAEQFVPTGSEHGVLVDRTALRQAGVKSASSYRLALSLAFWWHDPGKMRVPIPKGRGRTGKLWRQTRKVERYPVVTDAELIAMTYPSEANNVDSTRRSRLQRSRKALAFLVDLGYAAIEDGRIMPGRNWAGWGETEDVGRRTSRSR